MTRNEHTKFVDRPNLPKKDKNKTTLFMLPSLNLTSGKTSFELMERFGFVNCYMDHPQSFNTVPDCVYMVFNPSKEVMKDFGKFYDLYKTYPNFITDYSVDRNLIIVVFRVKDKWRPSYREFKKSHYSGMSKEYADLFKRPDIATGRVHTATEYFIILKHKEYKTFLENFLDATIDDDAELMDELNPKKEIFNYEFNIRETGTTEVQSGEGERQIGESGGSSIHLQST
jgi:hypothetical protein